MTLKDIQAEKKRIMEAIKQIRDKRAARINQILNERQALMDETASIAGTKPKKAELITADYELLEKTFNVQIHELKNQLQSLEALEAAASVDPLETQLEKAQTERDKAAATLAEKEADVRALEGHIQRALDVVEREKTKKAKKTRFESKLDFIQKTKNSRLRKKLEENILNF